MQALANRDPAVLADTPSATTTTSSSRPTRACSTRASTSIELVNLEWGPITVDGSTAQRTTFETWRTSYATARPTFARDRNVYSLMQDSQRRLEDRRDEHPDGRNRGAPCRTPDPPSAPPPDSPARHRHVAQLVGLRRARRHLHQRLGHLDGPQLALDGPFGADAAWVGIGGMRSRDLIQAGTQQTVVGHRQR